jgi:Fic family protein
VDTQTDTKLDKKGIEISLALAYQPDRERKTRTGPMPEQRLYERSHPWLTFRLDLRKADPRLWLALGEAQSKCQHIAGVPLQPVVAAALHAVYLAKGIQATTAIEGNTLSEAEVKKRIEGDLRLPPSTEYLGKEVDNVLKATNSLLDLLAKVGRSDIISEQISEFNRMILDGLRCDDGIEPGRIRTYPVFVGRYEGAPYQDCHYLLDRLCGWLNSDDFSHGQDADNEIAYGILKSIVSHVYFAWIHPFGDGNGRTARLLEVKFLLESGVPTAAAHLLSNHYNQTRSEYYRNLDRASKSGGDILPFIEYAVQGFCDQLREQLKFIRGQQWDVAWVNFVHEILGEHKTETGRRQRKLVLALSASEHAVLRQQIRRLTPELAELYADRKEKTLTRDLNAVVKTGLIERRAGSYRARKERILAFLPRVKTEQFVKALQKTRSVTELHGVQSFPENDKNLAQPVGRNLGSLALTLASQPHLI